MSTSIKKIDIKIDGKPYAGDYNFLNIVWTQEVLKPNEFRFTMQKRKFLKEEPEVSFAVPKALIGKSLTCMIQTERYDEKAELQNETLEFEGTVFNIEVSRSELVSEILIHVTAFSDDYILIDNNNCTAFSGNTLQEIVAATIEPYKFKKTIDPGFTTAIPYSVQYKESNYEFLVRLAQRYGEWLYHDGKQLVFGKLKEAPPAIQLYARTDMLNYQYSAKITHDHFVHGSANYILKTSFQKEPKDIDISSGEGLFTKELKDMSQTLYQKRNRELLHCAMLEENDADELEISVKAQYLGDKSEISVCSGSTVRADMMIGKRFTIKDFYDKDNNQTGVYDHEELFVYKIVHKAHQNGFYENEFMAISGKCEYPPYHNCDVYPVAPTQFASIYDNNDPEKLGRVRLEFIWQPPKIWTPWVRIAQPHGGINKGFYYIPEKGEEVMVGFVHGNAEKPYVIGTLYNGIDCPDKGKWYTASNDVKAIRTRNGHTIEIRDMGEDGYIRIYDNLKENYILTFSTDEKKIKLESKGNIELYAKQNIIIGAGGSIAISAGGNMDTTVGINDSLYVGANQSVEIKGSKDETIDADYQLTSDYMRIEANGKLEIYGSDIDEKSKNAIKMDGGDKIDLYAAVVRIN